MAVEKIDGNTMDDFSTEMIAANTKAVVWTLPYVEHNLTFTPKSAVQLGTRLIRDAMKANNPSTDEGRHLEEQAIQWSEDWIWDCVKNNARLRDRLEDLLATQ